MTSTVDIAQQSDLRQGIPEGNSRLAPSVPDSSACTTSMVDLGFSKESLRDSRLSSEGTPTMLLRGCEKHSNGFKIIAATSSNGGIGLNGNLPWRNSTDMKYFKNVTTQRIDETKINAIIMGRKTFKSLDYKPLPNRLNVCITSMDLFTAYHFFGVDKKDVLFFNSLDTALEKLYKNSQIENIFVIGGRMLYKCALNHSDCEELLINRIQCDVDCDTFFPNIDSTQYLLSDSSRLDNNVVNERYIHRRLHSKTL